MAQGKGLIMSNEARSFSQWVFSTVVTPPIKAVLAVINKLMRRATGHKSVYETEALEWAHKVEAAFPQIQAEVLRVMQQKQIIPNALEFLHREDHKEYESDWRIFPLYWFGNRIEDSCAMCPVTEATLAQVPDLMSAAFSILEPHQHIGRHAHPYLGHLIFHLGLVIPEPESSCRMDVEGQVLTWSEGKVLLFDPTYDHEVWNDSDHVRIILAGELRRPVPFYLQPVDGAFWLLLRYSPWGRKTLRRVRERARKHRELADAADQVPAHSPTA
jgi:aspartyl/asparaginyl beta-hydroxylase (cupin superfamily)